VDRAEILKVKYDSLRNLRDSNYMIWIDFFISKKSSRNKQNKNF